MTVKMIEIIIKTPEILRLFDLPYLSDNVPTGIAVKRQVKPYTASAIPTYFGSPIIFCI